MMKYLIVGKICWMKYKIVDKIDKINKNKCNIFLMVYVKKDKNSRIYLFLENIENHEQYHDLTNAFEEIYKSKTRFNLLIETVNVRKINMIYLYKFGRFLNDLKKRERLLDFTIIHVYDNNIYNLLYTLFTFIAKPIAKVTVIQYEGSYDVTINDYNSDYSIHKNISRMKEYYP